MSWLKYTIFFLFFFALGFSTRILFFSYYQLPAGKEYFQELPLVQDQGGSETPELALRTYDLYQKRIVELSKIGLLAEKLNPFYYVKIGAWKILDVAAKTKEKTRALLDSQKNQKDKNIPAKQTFSLKKPKEEPKEQISQEKEAEQNVELKIKENNNYQENKPDINQEVALEIINLLEETIKEEIATQTEITTSSKKEADNESTTTKELASSTQTINTSTATEQTSPQLTTQPTQPNPSPPIFFTGGPTIPPPQPKDKCEELSKKAYLNLIISEIQYESKNNKDDEFIEIYNPNSEAIDLTCWTLEKIASKKSATDTPSTTILWPKTKSSGTIKPFGFYLLASQSYASSTAPDYQYANSYSIAKNNTLILRKTDGQISDLVGAGEEKEKIYQFETEPFIGDQFSEFTLQRKNLIDTDNNRLDFWFHPANPENSQANPRTPNPEFFDLSLTDFSLETSFDATNSLVTINFDLNPKPTTSANFDYEILLDASQTIFAFSSSSKPNLDFNTTTLTFNLNSCPATKSTYEISFKIFDLNDDLNYALATDTLSLPEEFCNPPPTTPPKPKDGAQKGKVLISEVLLGADSAKEEFIELYNLNPFPVDLTGYSLVRYYTKRDNSLGEQTILPKSKFTGVIPAYAYFLIVNQSASTTFGLPDLYYAKSYNLAKDNAIALLDPENNIVDLVGWGNAPKFENNPYPDNPAENQSLHRKATDQGDLEKNYGNAYDTDNNQNDLLIATPEPKNSDYSEAPPLEITGLNLEISTTTFQFSWLSPYATETDFTFVLTNSINTSTVTITFQTLTYQTISFDACSLFGETEVATGTQFTLQLLNATTTKDQKTITLSESFTNCVPSSPITVNDFDYRSANQITQRHPLLSAFMARKIR